MPSLLGSSQSPVRRAHARGAIVRKDRRRRCADSLGACRLKRRCIVERYARLGSISQDPIGFAAGDANLYRYVGNQAATLTDPSGLEPPVDDPFDHPWAVPPDGITIPRQTPNPSGSIGQDPNPPNPWFEPLEYDAANPNHGYKPGGFREAASDAFHRSGGGGFMRACQDPWGPSFFEIMEGLISTVVNWDEIPGYEKRDMVVQTAMGVAAGGIVKPSTVPARRGTGFSGHRGFELHNSPLQPTRNVGGVVNGRSFSGHALDQMQNRGIPLSVVEQTLCNGIPFAGKRPGTQGFFDPTNKIRVIINLNTGNVITVIPGKP